MAEPFIGQIILFAGNFAPRNWMFCQGQTLSISQNTALFSILGTTYGGDGINTFQLPDLRGRVPVNPGQGIGLSNYVLGQATGSEQVTLAMNQMPIHNHTVAVNPGAGNISTPNGNFIAANPSRTVENFNTASTANAFLNATSVQQAGGSQPHSNVQPVLALNYIIAIFGTFPARN
jgi:microcystin-dependent protein